MHAALIVAAAAVALAAVAVTALLRTYTDDPDKSAAGPDSLTPISDSAR